MEYKSLTQYIAAFLLMALSLNASAINCNQESPNHKKEGKQYFDIIKPDNLTRQQKSNISKLFKKFAGENLRGNSSITECMGSVKNARKKITSETINAELKQYSDGGIVIPLESFNESKKVIHSEKLDYFGYNNQHHINELTNNKIIVSYKLRKKKILNEEITELSVNNNTLTIKTTRYVGGYFALQQIRNLSL